MTDDGKDANIGMRNRWSKIIKDAESFNADYDIGRTSADIQQIIEEMRFVQRKLNGTD